MCGSLGLLFCDSLLFELYCPQVPDALAFSHCSLCLLSPFGTCVCYELTRIIKRKKPSWMWSSPYSVNFLLGIIALLGSAWFVILRCFLMVVLCICFLYWFWWETGFDIRHFFLVMAGLEPMCMHFLKSLLFCLFLLRSKSQNNQLFRSTQFCDILYIHNVCACIFNLSKCSTL